jgi:hypothetical protein
MSNMGPPYSAYPIGPSARNAVLERPSLSRVAGEEKRLSLPCFMPVCEPPFGGPRDFSEILRRGILGS